jgi:ribosomal protein S18 acetylase RimI-like enzyme
VTDRELYARSIETVLACSEALARGSRGASLERLDGAAAAVFPSGPERAFYNNAVLEPGRFDVLDELEAVYAAAGVTRFAAWVHESDSSVRVALEGRGYRLDEVTRAMGMTLDELPPRAPLELGEPSWNEHLRLIGVPEGFLAGFDPASFHVLVAVLDGKGVSTSMSFDHDGDCGIFNVGTFEHARRRGLAGALTLLQLHDAQARGCRTASLQSTPEAVHLYSTAGFRDLGRILEYVPVVSDTPGSDSTS